MFVLSQQIIFLDELSNGLNSIIAHGDACQQLLSTIGHHQSIFYRDFVYYLLNSVAYNTLLADICFPCV